MEKREWGMVGVRFRSSPFPLEVFAESAAPMAWRVRRMERERERMAGMRGR